MPFRRVSQRKHEASQSVYKSFDIDFEPKWFPVIYTLHIKEMLSVVEIASEIGYSHPSTISLLKELEKLKIISSKKDKLDERKRLIVLTTKGKELVVKMQPVWTVMKKTLNEITDNQNNLLKAIEETEQNLIRTGFLQRALELKTETETEN